MSVEENRRERQGRHGEQFKSRRSREKFKETKQKNLNQTAAQVQPAVSAYPAGISLYHHF